MESSLKLLKAAVENDCVSSVALVHNMSPVSQSKEGRRIVFGRVGKLTSGDLQAPGVQCPTCARRGVVTWVIPGKLCHVCGTPC
jgi:hypothetical protein